VRLRPGLSTCGKRELCGFARSSIASNTGAKLPGEEFMTGKTSAIVVSRANASSRSVVLSFSLRWALSRSALDSPSSHRRSVMMRIG
jgi:hypothetical protein